VPPRWSRNRIIWTIVITALLTSLAVVIALNFVTPS
jgi:type IV secretory pathway component VirB8